MNARKRIKVWQLIFLGAICSLLLGACNLNGQSADAELTTAPVMTPPSESEVDAEPSLTAAILGQHEVRSGETYECIGRAYGVMPEAIAIFNENRTLAFGDVINIPDVQWTDIPSGVVCDAQFLSPFAAGLEANNAPDEQPDDSAATSTISATFDCRQSRAGCRTEATTAPTATSTPSEIPTFDCRQSRAGCRTEATAAPTATPMLNAIPTLDCRQSRAGCGSGRDIGRATATFDCTRSRAGCG